MNATFAVWVGGLFVAYAGAFTFALYREPILLVAFLYMAFIIGPDEWAAYVTLLSLLLFFYIGVKESD